MATSLGHQRNLTAVIDKFNDKHDLTAWVNTFELDELKSLLQLYVTNQAPPETVTRWFCQFGALPDIIGTDCLDHTFDYLDYNDMCSVSRVSSLFNQSLTRKKNKMMNNALLDHPMFLEFIYGDDWEGTFKLGYVPKYKYDHSLLDQYSFKGLGRNGVLKGEDMSIWNICHHFKFRTHLVPWLERFDGKTVCTHCPLRDVRGGLIPEEDDFEPEWNALNGIEETEYNYSLYVSPAFEITCRDLKWRDNFIIKHLQDGIFQRLFSKHPMFGGYSISNDNQSGEYLIGYMLRNRYKLQDLTQHSFDSLCEMGILKGRDRVIWRLTRHFRFETKRYLIYNNRGYGFYRNWRDKSNYGIRLYPEEQIHGDFDIDWNTDQANWQSVHWNDIYGITRRLRGMDRIAWFTNQSGGAYLAIEIRCARK